MQRPSHLLSATSARPARERFIAAATGVVLLHLLFAYAMMSGLAARVTQALPHIIDVRILNASPPPVELLPPPLPEMVQPKIDLVPLPEIRIAAPAQSQAITVEQRPVETITTAPRPAPVNTPAPRAIAPTPAKAIAATHTTPPYPPLSRRLSEQGTVLLHIAVAEDGSVAQAMVEKSSGSERLDEAARDWVRQHWRYHPATHNGKPVASEMKVNVVFNLRVTR